MVGSIIRVVLTQLPNNIMNVNKYTHVNEKILDINWWTFILLHILSCVT